jgi:hypothetical protein
VGCRLTALVAGSAWAAPSAGSRLHQNLVPRLAQRRDADGHRAYARIIVFDFLGNADDNRKFSSNESFRLAGSSHTVASGCSTIKSQSCIWRWRGDEGACAGYRTG